MPHLPALFVLLAGTETAAGRRRRRTRRGTDVSTPVSDAKAISYLRSRQITLTYDPQSGTLQADSAEAVTTMIDRASYHPRALRPRTEECRTRRGTQVDGLIARHGREPGPG